MPAMHDLDALWPRLRAAPFRRKFRLGPNERDYLRRHGRAAVLRHAADFVARRLAPAQPARDGRQTPWRGHPVFIAQHATATCCRGCLETWHGIARGHALSAAEQAHAVAAIARWLAETADASAGTEPEPRQRSLL
ncbi:DUF4186 domain-containing protein [Frateuria defendens]|uniref:DUF4186 domain-containing protein n=1 Tax=Frateuria defendens TaxID=2219559 RepID=UPI000AFC64FF|nr:DUF4186 domain-containing protein [Frateuria defendens]